MFVEAASVGTFICSGSRVRLALDVNRHIGNRADIPNSCIFCLSNLLSCYYHCAKLFQQIRLRNKGDSVKPLEHASPLSCCLWGPREKWSCSVPPWPGLQIELGKARYNWLRPQLHPLDLLQDYIVEWRKIWYGPCLPQNSWEWEKNLNGRDEKERWQLVSQCLISVIA